jgi:hypothetical protein
MQQTLSLSSDTIYASLSQMTPAILQPIQKIIVHVHRPSHDPRPIPVLTSAVMPHLHQLSVTIEDDGLGAEALSDSQWITIVKLMSTVKILHLDGTRCSKQPWERYMRLLVTHGPRPRHHRIHTVRFRPRMPESAHTAIRLGIGTDRSYRFNSDDPTTKLMGFILREHIHSVHTHGDFYRARCRDRHLSHHAYSIWQTHPLRRYQTADIYTYGMPSVINRS